MKNFLPFIFAFSLLAFGTLHKNLETTQVHSPFRWVFADSAARVAEAVTTSDTDKVAYQKSDSSMWVLRDNSPKTWICMSNRIFINSDATFYYGIDTLTMINVAEGGGTGSLNFSSDNLLSNIIVTSSINYISSATIPTDSAYCLFMNSLDIDANTLDFYFPAGSIYFPVFMDTSGTGEDYKPMIAVLKPKNTASQGEIWFYNGKGNLLKGRNCAVYLRPFTVTFTKK